MRGLVLMLVVACASEKTTTVDGAALYATFCASCHGPDGRPDATMAARLGVRDLTAADLRARITPALVERQVRTGSKNGLMPAFERGLSDEQIRAVAAYVASATFLKR